MGFGGLRPHCAGHIRALYGTELARSKMGYEAAAICLIRVLRGGLGPLWRLAQLPGPRRTSDQFHTPRKTLLSPDNNFFLVLPFLFPPNSEKRCLHGENRDFGSSEGDFDRKEAPQELESAFIRSARRFPTFPCLRGSRDQFYKTNNCDSENFIPVKYHTKRISVGNKFIRHREPPQNTNL